MTPRQSRNRRVAVDTGEKGIHFHRTETAPAEPVGIAIDGDAVRTLNQFLYFLFGRRLCCAEGLPP